MGLGISPSKLTLVGRFTLVLGKRTDESKPREYGCLGDANIPVSYTHLTLPTTP